MKEITSREAYSYEPERDYQGKALDDLIERSKTPIDEDSVLRSRCMTLKPVDRVCYKVVKNHALSSVTKVYVGFWWLGYNIRYHGLKNGSLDALHKMDACINECSMSDDPDIIDMLMYSNLFPDGTSRVYRMDKAKMGEVDKEAVRCGVNRSELNLFNVLTGIKRLLSDEPYYIERQDERVYRQAIDEFLSVSARLRRRATGLYAIWHEERGFND